MTQAREVAWASALTEARKRSTERSRVPLALRKKQTAEELAYRKDQLAEHSKAGDATKVEADLRALVRLRAKQFALTAEESRAERGGMTEEQIAEEIRRYYDDCAAFINLIETD